MSQKVLIVQLSDELEYRLLTRKAVKLRSKFARKMQKRFFSKKMASWIVFKGSGLKNTNIKKSFATTVWKL